jgi:sulfur relay (sulfurtransferase) complex TusBCD TusD component (DsrE family)
LTKHEGEKVRVFLIGEGAACAHSRQKVPPGHYNIEVMLKAVRKHGGEIGVCASCIDARGIADQETGCAAYLLGCGTLGRCAVVDPHEEDVES